MVQLKTACVLLVLLSAAWLSTARLHPGTEIEIDAISTLKASAATTASEEAKKAKSQVATLHDHRNSKKLMGVGPQVVRDKGMNNAKSSSSSSHHSKVERKRSLRSRLSDEVDKGFVAFSSDYHAPRHHPPKNN